VRYTWLPTNERWCPEKKVKLFNNLPVSASRISRRVNLVLQSGEQVLKNSFHFAPDFDVGFFFFWLWFVGHRSSKKNRTSWIPTQQHTPT
jgi:hypothetical protein